MLQAIQCSVSNGKCTFRIKEILITAGGENVPPFIIEDMVFALSWHHKTDPDGHHHYDPAHHNDHHQVKKELPCLSHVVLIGDRRKFLSCLVTLKLEVIFSLLLFVCLGSFLNKFDICPGTICRGTKCQRWNKRKK